MSFPENELENSVRDPQIDKFLHPSRDRPMWEFKWLQKEEKKWENPYHAAGMKNRCDMFRNDWFRCADGLSIQRAKAECRLELEDMLECIQSNKQYARQKAILQQRDKLIKEGKYTPPPFPEC